MNYVVSNISIKISKKYDDQLYRDLKRKFPDISYRHRNDPVDGSTISRIVSLFETILPYDFEIVENDKYKYWHNHLYNSFNYLMAYENKFSIIYETTLYYVIDIHNQIESKYCRMDHLLQDSLFCFISNYCAPFKFIVEYWETGDTSIVHRPLYYRYGKNSGQHIYHSDCRVTNKDLIMHNIDQYITNGITYEMPDAKYDLIFIW